VASNRDHNSLHLFAIDPASGVLTGIGEVATPLTEIYGLCLFKDRQGAIDAIVNDKDGTFLQYRLSGANGKASGELLRRFKTATQPEGCVADDRNQRLYIGEEDVAVWTLDARAEVPATLEQVIAVGGPVQDDIEGMGLYHGQQRDYLVISSQGNDSYVVVEAQAPYRLRGSFRIGLNAARGIDGASETDGLEVTSANLGGPWSAGLLVVQDGRKRMPEGNQNYKYVPWEAVAAALGLE
jgi:3-phytase